MLKFADLSKSQKKCIIALIEADPTLKTDGKISLKQVVSITQDLAKNRSTGAPKIGYPNWLFKYNKVERGLYELPVPSEQELSEYAQGSVKQPKVKAAKVIKTKQADTQEDSLAMSRLQKIVDESPVYDEDVEDFNQILRENGIEV